MNWDKVEFTNHEAYLEIALEHLNLSQKTDDDLKIKIGVTSSTYQGVSLSFENSVYLVDQLHLINKSNIVSIVFSALAAESFINYYALSHAKDEDYLRRFRSDRERQLSEAVVKWIKIPHKITGRFALTYGSTEVNCLQKLFDDRNKLAHHQASLQEFDSSDFENMQHPNAVTIQDAKSGYCAVVKAIRMIQTIDSGIDISWLNDETEFWLEASQTSLDAVWDNAEDDVYAQLLQA